MTRKRTPKRAERPTKRTDRPVPAARTVEVVRRSEAPADLARATIVDGLLALASPTRRAKHKDAAQAVAEGVTLAGVAAARSLLDEHDAAVHQRHPDEPRPADPDLTQLRCADLRGWSDELDGVLNEIVHLGSAASRNDGSYAVDALAAAVTVQYLRDELRHAVEHPDGQVSP